jgi:hypothetical protein
MNPKMQRFIYIGLLTISGPAFSLLSRKLHLTPEDAKDYLDILQVITPLVGGAWGVAETTNNSLVKAAENVPGVATVVIKDTANGALGDLAQSEAHPNIVTETQNEADAKLGSKVL